MAFIDENKVLKFYLEQMGNDKINFLKGKEKFKSRIAYEINQLIEEKDMHHKIGTAKKLWKLLFEAAMSYIDPDKRGYDDIFSYFDEYVNFEELIFASDSFYRDHTLHCLWVYFLGEYLRKSDEYKDILVDEWKQTQMVIEDFAKSLNESKHREIFKDFIYISEIINWCVDNRDAIWCVTSLTHDLGYPIKKISKINKAFKKYSHTSM